MGLDVIAVKNAVKFDDPKVSEAEDLDCVYGGHFPERLGSLVEGAYYDGEIGESHYRNGYGRHGAFREKLAEIAGYEKKPVEKPKYSDPHFFAKNYEHLHPHVASVWEAENGPFYELIFFSDCEGYLGPEVCKKLAADFDEYLEAANSTDNEWFKKSYSDMRAVIKEGAQNGYVKFG